jgi:hypothetical protein
VKEWRYAQGQFEVVFQVIRGPGLDEFADLVEQLTGHKLENGGNEIARLNRIFKHDELFPGRDTGPDGRKNGKAILVFSTKGRELSQSELEEYDRWSKDFALVEKCLDAN